MSQIYKKRNIPFETTYPQGDITKYLISVVSEYQKCAYSSFQAANFFPSYSSVFTLPHPNVF